MANDEISDISTTIDCSGNIANEPALADGTAKAGMAVYLDPSTGKAVALDGDSATAGLHFLGVLDRRHDTDIDTAPTAGVLVNILKPVPGEVLAVFIEDPGAAAYKGTPVTFGQTTAGSFKIITTKASTGRMTPTIALSGNAEDIVIEYPVAKLEKDIANGDTVAFIRWGL